MKTIATNLKKPAMKKNYKPYMAKSASLNIRTYRLGDKLLTKDTSHTLSIH